MSTSDDDDFDNDALQEGLGHTLLGRPMASLEPAGLGSDLTSPEAGAPPLSYVDIYAYKGKGINKFGHLGISMNGGRTYGLEPIPGEEAASIAGNLRGYVQPIPRERPPVGHVRIPVTASAASTVKQYILSNPGIHGYSLAGPNCVSFVQGALDEAGVQNPVNAFLMTPAGLLERLAQRYGPVQR